MEKNLKYILPAIVFALLIWFASKFSYNISNGKNENASTTSIIPEGIPGAKALNYQVKANSFPNVFEQAFNKDFLFASPDSFSFKSYEVGKINIESGKVTACDPVVIQDAGAFAQLFPKGKYPVEAAMTQGRIAYCRIKFSNEPVKKWYAALMPGQDSIDITSDKIHCFGVDAGQAFFADEKAVRAFDYKNDDVWKDAFIDASEKSHYTAYMYDFGSHNLAVFATGYGDGCYACYIGYDSTGKVCRLLADFQIVQYTDWK